jgi:hypothetical protein
MKESEPPGEYGARPTPTVGVVSGHPSPEHAPMQFRLKNPCRTGPVPEGGSDGSAADVTAETGPFDGSAVDGGGSSRDGGGAARLSDARGGG